MNAHGHRPVGPLLGACALLLAPLSACAQSTAAQTTPAPNAPATTAEMPASEPGEVAPVPEPEVLTAQVDAAAVADESPAAPRQAADTASPVPAQTAPEPDDGIAEARRTLQTYLQATTSLRADFRSVLLDERKLPVAESSGVVMVKRPHRFRWEYEEPSPSLILADGERLWSYDAELEQAVVRDLADLEGANPSNLLGGDTQIDEDFDVLGSYRSDTIEWVELRPRGGSDFTRVRLGFSSGKIELMELHDQLGQVTQIALSSLEANPDLADSLFRFEPPPGTDVVGAD